MLSKTLAYALGILLLGCGGAPSDGPNNSNQQNNNNNYSSSSSCCLNGVHYSCPSDAAARACAGFGNFDLDGCLSGCAPEDFSCPDGCFQQQDSAMTSPDPSQCTQAPGSCNSPNPPPPQGRDCSLGGLGCTYDSDCPGSKECNTHTDRCFSPSANCIGTPCTYDSDCGQTAKCNSTVNQCVAK